MLDSLSNSPIENATVQLFLELKPVKSTLSKADGSFSFQNINNGTYQLYISHVGYKTQIVWINTVNENLKDLQIKLQLDEIDLKEVSVVANKPLISQKNGDIIYQIEGGIWQNSGNALGLINKIPILKGRQGSNYLLFGSKVNFLLDGKPIDSQGLSLEAALSNLGSIDIDKIEILQAPPPSLARYGKPIVHIKTVKQKENGSLVSLSHGYGKGINDRFNNGIRYSYKQEAFVLGLNVGQNLINQQNKTYSLKQSSNLLFNDTGTEISKTDLYNVKLNAGYTSAKMGAINLFFDHKNIHTPLDKVLLGQYSIFKIKDSLSLRSNAKSENKQTLAGIDYTKKFNKYLNINASMEMGKFDLTNRENIFIQRATAQNNLQNPWQRAIFFQNYFFENEAKINDIGLKAGFYFKKSNSETVFVKNVGSDNSFENNFDYEENIFTTFLNGNFSKGKNDFSLNINLEETDVKGLSSSDSKRLKFYSLLPSFSINHQINEVKSWNLTYSRGINRPEYTWLNQQELFKNPYNKYVGGGVLQPTIFNKISASATLVGGLSLTSIYAQQRNRYSFFPFVHAENSINYSAINVQNFYYIYTSLAFQKYLSKIWYLAADISGYYASMKSEDYGIRNSGYTQQLSISNYFTFKKLGQFGLNASYNSTDYADSYQFLPQFYVNIEYNKAIFKKRGSLNLTLSDLSNALKDRYVYQLDRLTVRDSYKYETRLLKISINYRLGNKNMKTAEAKKPKSESEINRLK